MIPFITRILALLLLAITVRAAEIATGAMLGGSYDPRAFYTRSAPGADWLKTYSGAEYRPEAQGKLMNIRLDQALTHEVVTEALDFYKKHGVLMIDVTLDEAFQADGSLVPEPLTPLDRLIRAADQLGMMVDLIYFHAGHDQPLQSTAAVHHAAWHITDWLIAHNFRNVIIDVANEYDLPGGQWDLKGYIPQNIIPLIDEVRERYRHAGYVAPIGASSDGRMRYPHSIEGQVDVVMLHGNGRDSKEKLRRATQLKEARRPVLMTADNNGHAGTPERLTQELASCDIFFHHAAGWGYTPAAPAEPDPAFLQTVLDHIAGLTLKSPPRRQTP